MITKASGLLAVLFAAGLFACVFAPSPVEAAGSGGTTASDSDNATSVKKQSTRHAKRDKSAKTEAKSTESKSTESKPSETKKPDSATVADAAAVSTSLPASVANAKAELTPNVPADNASAMSAKANTLLAASDKPDEAKEAGDADVVASDQLNEVDRALQESQSQNQPAAQPQQAAPAVAMTTAQAPAGPVASAGNPAWDRTSLVGKIFIAAGALLTMASAARMFMA
jgi:DNA polymerase III gamma/tau subunit